MGSEKAFILGVVEGLTEFLPISSTAHLILASFLLKIPQTDYWKFFQVFIQSGAILAVIFSFINSLIDRKIVGRILLSFVPTAIVGLLFYGMIKKVLFESLLIIAASLIGFGLLFLLIEHLAEAGRLHLKKDLQDMTWQEAIILGLVQSIAIIPGVSRAGAVLVGGMLLGFRRRQAAVYSFLLAVPTIVAASFLDVIKTDKALLLKNINLSIVGFFTAMITAFFVVNWFVKYLQKNNLRHFAYYRIILGLALLVLLFIV